MAPSASQRREVYERAGGCCEYCRRSVDVRLVEFEIDHIVSRKYGGNESSDNLCLTCAPCNLHKGPEVAGIDPLTDEATRLFNPRQQIWREHFEINADGSHSGLTPEGRAKVAALRLNEAPRVEQRFSEILLGNWPCQSNS